MFAGEFLNSSPTSCGFAARTSKSSGPPRGMKQSGLGREAGLEGLDLDAYRETKYVSVGLRQG